MLKKGLLKTLLLTLALTIIILPTLASAATKNFTFNMKHQLSIGQFTSTKNSVTGTVNMSSWGGDTYFTIHIYERGSIGSVNLVDRLGFQKSSSGSPYSDTSYNVTKGKSYGYEIWKNQNGKTIIGSGSLSY